MFIPLVKKFKGLNQKALFMKNYTRTDYFIPKLGVSCMKITLISLLWLKIKDLAGKFIKKILELYQIPYFC